MRSLTLLPLLALITGACSSDSADEGASATIEATAGASGSAGGAGASPGQGGAAGGGAGAGAASGTNGGAGSSSAGTAGSGGADTATVDPSRAGNACMTDAECQPAGPVPTSCYVTKQQKDSGQPGACFFSCGPVNKPAPAAAAAYCSLYGGAKCQTFDANPNDSEPPTALVCVPLYMNTESKTVKPSTLGQACKTDADCLFAGGPAKGCLKPNPDTSLEGQCTFSCWGVEGPSKLGEAYCALYGGSCSEKGLCTPPGGFAQ